MYDAKLIQTLLDIKTGIKNVAERDNILNDHIMYRGMGNDMYQLVATYDDQLEYIDRFGTIYHLYEENGEIRVKHIEMRLPQDLTLNDFNTIVEWGDKDAVKDVFSALTNPDDRVAYGLKPMYYHILYSNNKAVEGEIVFTWKEIKDMLASLERENEEEDLSSGKVEISFAMNGDVEMYGEKVDCERVFQLIKDNTGGNIYINDALAN